MNGWPRAAILHLFSSLFTLNPVSSIPCRLSPTENLLAAWIAGLSGTIAAGWILSSADALRFSWATALVIWAAFIILILRYSRSAFQNSSSPVLPPESSLKSAFRFPPFLILGTVIFATAFLYLPVTHDSLSYRIPRMYLWLQEGHVGYVPTSDPRINYMTHNWELASLPVMQILGVRFLPIASVISWILLYLLGRSWAGAAGFQDRLQNWVGLMPALSTFSILQARSTVNDLFAATLILSSAWFAFSFHRAQDRWKPVLSGLALALACGTKPHYIVLGAPWTLWLLFGRPAPWRSIPWRHVAWLLPLFLFVSPLPAFIINSVETGSYKGIPSSETFVGGNPVFNIIFGGLAFLWQSVQPPLNPFAGTWNALILDSSLLRLAKVAVPRFSLNIGYAQIVDGGGVGLFILIPCVMGLYRSFRVKHIAAIRWIAAAGIAGFLLAVSQVVPGSIGRSFLGFFFLLFPLVFCGLRATGRRSLEVLIIFALIACFMTVLLDAARPIFPAKQLLVMIEKVGLNSKYATSLLESFIGFRQRADAGSGLIQQIRSGTRLLVVSGAGDPLVAIWTQGSAASVHLAQTEATIDWVRGFDPDAVLVTGTGPEMHANLIREISEDYRFVDSEYYLVRLQRGKEKWELFERQTPRE